MDPQPSIRIEIYVTAAGDAPFERWIDGLRDRMARAKVRVQIDRLSLGNFGKCRFLKGGLGELKIDWGPGYRVYFGMVDQKAVLLLCGGDKSSQQKDIDRAQEYWAGFRRRHHGKPS